MILADVLSTIMVMAEAKERGWLAGLLDMAAWYVSIATTSISVTTLSGHNTVGKIYVLVLVGLSNVVGTKTGQMCGSRLLKTKRDKLVAAAARSGR
jgi:hypothetical protein